MCSGVPSSVKCVVNAGDPLGKAVTAERNTSAVRGTRGDAVASVRKNVDELGTRARRGSCYDSASARGNTANTTSATSAVRGNCVVTPLPLRENEKLGSGTTNSCLSLIHI